MIIPQRLHRATLCLSKLQQGQQCLSAGSHDLYMISGINAGKNSHTPLTSDLVKTNLHGRWAEETFMVVPQGQTLLH